MLIDLDRIEAVHQGGKDEVSYNLLRGFSKLGLTNNILCACRKELVDIIKAIDPNFATFASNRRHFQSKLDVPRAVAKEYWEYLSSFVESKKGTTRR